MKKPILTITLAIIGSTALFVGSASANFEWHGGMWHLSEPCNLGNVLWCQWNSDICHGAQTCGGAILSTSRSSTASQLVHLPQGRTAYVPTGTQRTGPNAAELKTRKAAPKAPTAKR